MALRRPVRILPLNEAQRQHHLLIGRAALRAVIGDVHNRCFPGCRIDFKFAALDRFTVCKQFPLQDIAGEADEEMFVLHTEGLLVPIFRAELDILIALLHFIQLRCNRSIRENQGRCRRSCRHVGDSPKSPP